jgi:hypothetical protein
MSLLFAGNYAVFEKTAAERLRNLRSRIESQEAHRKHVQVRSWALHLVTSHSRSSTPTSISCWPLFAQQMACKWSTDILANAGFHRQVPVQCQEGEHGAVAHQGAQPAGGCRVRPPLWLIVGVDPSLQTGAMSSSALSDVQPETLQRGGLHCDLAAMAIWKRCAQVNDAC